MSINETLAIASSLNHNFLSPLGFGFSVKRLPHINFFVQRIGFPGISFASSDVPTPFTAVKYPGDHLIFDDLTVEFKIDEDMNSYLEIFDWMVENGFPDNFDQFKNGLERAIVPNKKQAIISDATVSILTSSYNTNLQFNFEDIFPVALSAIQFSTTDNDVSYISATAQFAYTKFTYERIKK